MQQDQILNLASKSYHQATLNVLKLNLPDLKRIESLIIEDNQEIALMEIQRLIKFFERDIGEKETKIEIIKKEYNKSLK
jgi:hypothetical protein